MSWAATAITVRGAPAGSTSPALGIFLLSLATIMIVLSVGAVPSKPLFGLLLLIGASRFAVTAVYQIYGWTRLETVAGWIGVPLAALSGDLTHQLRQAEREAGVRRQL